MPLADPLNSFLLVVDLQTKFLAPIFEKERVLARSKFLIEVAGLLDIPIFATEQNPERMGGPDPAVGELMAKFNRPILPKMCFSGATDFGVARQQAVIVGIETHICVNQTAQHLADDGLEVFVVADAVSARTREMHDLALRRIGDEAATIAHSESIAYEWLQTAEHPKFREVLEIVKRG